MSSLYFDYAAATPMSSSVLDAMRPYFTEQFYNPSALYMAAEEVKQAVAGAREVVAKTLECKPSEILFTAGGTESNNLAIHGVMQAFPEANCIVSAVEHDAVLEPASKYDRKVAPVKPDGRIDLIALEQLIDERTALVSIMYVNNEVGTVQPLREVSQIIKQKREERKKQGNDIPLVFHTDACQAANYLPLLVNGLGVDLMTLNGGKIYGPKQSGVLFVRTGTMLVPQILGGGQERGYRSGTENVPSVVGFATALHETRQLQEQESERLANLQQLCVKELTTKIPQAIINGSLRFRIPNNMHITLPGTDNERLLMELDLRGIQVATGSACSASSDEPSHVLRALGLSDEAARSSLRITFGRSTEEADIRRMLSELAALIA